MACANSAVLFLCHPAPMTFETHQQAEEYSLTHVGSYDLKEMGIPVAAMPQKKSMGKRNYSITKNGITFEVQLHSRLFRVIRCPGKVAKQRNVNFTKDIDAAWDRVVKLTGW
eukprot:15434765-Alexandrium_andersonii.AAC.1